MVLISGIFVFLAYFGGASKYTKRASFSALVMHVVVFLEDGNDGGLISTMSYGDGNMTT